MTAITASQALGDILKSPDDLSKLPALRKRLTKESNSIQAKLSSGVKDQLDATRDGLRKLVAAKANLDAVEEEMRRIENACTDPRNQIRAFDKIAAVSVIHRNFSQTEEMVRSFQEISSKVQLVESMLAEDVEDGFDHPQMNLLPCHFQLVQLEAFRNVTLHQAKKGKPEELAAVKEYFERLDRVLAAFEARLWELTGMTLELVRNGRSDAVVKILKVVEAEGREDQKAAAMKLVKRSKAAAAAKFTSVQADARPIKHYRHKLLKVLTDTIHATFEAYEQTAADPSDFIDGLGWIYKDFLRIESDVTLCFPPDYDIHAYLIKAYHKRLNEILTQLVASSPEAMVLLQLHAWLKEYKANCKELGLDPSWTQPPLLAGKEQDLIEDYVSVIVKKMDEWTSNLMKGEERDFVLRDKAVEMEEGGLYGMQGAVIMFQMINQQVDAAAESGQGGVLSRVVGEANRVMRSTQERFVAVIQAEFKRSIGPEPGPGGLPEYIVALANDQIKSADYAEALSARLEPIVSAKYKEAIVSKINDAIDGYLDVAKVCTQTAIDLLFHDCKPETIKLFGPLWYTERPMAVVAATIQDYLLDYQEHLNPSIFELLVDDTVDSFLVIYLTALRKSSKLRMPSALDRIRDDVGEVFKVFAEFKRKEDLEVNFEVVEMILAMLEASKEMVFMDFWAFAQVHGPNLPFVEGLLRSRDNLDRTSVNEIMENVRRRIRIEKLGEPEERTIMTKIANVKDDGYLASLGLNSLSTFAANAVARLADV